MAWPGASWATIIARTITIDGSLSDWTSGAGGDILTNPGQFSQDAQDLCPGSQDRDSWSGGDISVGSCDGLSGGAGLDLKAFAFTYDQTNLYLYLSRYASSTNATDWWFYIDVNGDDKMDSTDLLFHVTWQGSSQTISREIWAYTPANPAGDPLTQTTGGGTVTADGYKMPGTISNRQVLPSATGGTVAGTEMETYIPWSSICGAGCGPRTLKFHIASSNGTDLPGNLSDNMDGPNGGAMVITDLSVGLTASDSSVVGGSGTPYTYTVSVNNQPPASGGQGGTATGISLDVQLPTNVSAPSYTLGSGQSATYNSTTHVLTWTINSLAVNTSVSLDLSVTPNAVTANTATTATASNLVLTEADYDSGNDTASTNVTIRPSPDLSITKTHAGDFTVQQADSWTLVVSNAAAAGTGTNVGALTVTDTLDSNLTFQYGSGTNWSCNAIGQVVTCSYSQDLPAGSSTPTLTLGVMVGASATNFTNTATVASAYYESNTANNSASDAVTVITGSGALECYAAGTNASSSPTLFKVNTATFSTTSSVALTAASTVGPIAYDCATGIIYGIRGGNQFGTIDGATGTFTDIGTGVSGITTVTGLSYDPTTGAMYGTEDRGGSGGVFQINIATGDIVADAFGPSVSELVISPKSAGDLSSDPVSGQLSVLDKGQTLVDFDRTTGSTTTSTTLPTNTFIGLSADNSVSNGLVASTSANGFYLIDGTRTVTSSGSVTGINSIQGMSCTYGCTAKLVDISVTQTASSSTIAINSNVTFVITVTNNGPTDATALQLQDVLSSLLTFSSYTATTGTYDSATGTWHIGSLANGASATLNIVASSGTTTTSGNPATNTASVAYVTQSDTNTVNDSATANVNIASSDLSTSAKSVQDLNGGQPNPGDVLQYTITLTDTAGVTASGVTVTDTQPPNTSNLTVLSIPAGATDNSGATYPLEIDNIAVPANGSVSIVFEVTVNANAASGATISNSATLTNPSGTPATGTLTSPDVSVVKSAQVKQLYVGPAAGETINTIVFPAYALGRLPFTSTTSVTLAGGGGTQTWILSPALASVLTIDGTSNPGGVSVPIQLVLGRAVAGPDRTAQVALGYDNSCTGGSITAIGQSANTTVLSGATGPVASTLSFNLAGNVTVPSGACVTLTITNNTSIASRSFDVYPAGAGTTSQVDLQVFSFINIDSLAFYSAPGGAGAPLTQIETGNNVYVRTTVSDPFGTYDINNVSLDLLDAGSNSVFTANPMTEDTAAATTGSKTYENGPIAVTTANVPGVWYASVTAMEGTEGLVQDQSLAPITVIGPPNLTVTKTVSSPTASPSNVLTYTMVVQNSGPGEASNVILQVLVNPFSSLNVSYGGSTPFVFTDDATTPSYLTMGTITYSFDNGATALASSGFDANVNGFTINMNGTMAKNGKFTITYQMKLR